MSHAVKAAEPPSARTAAGRRRSAFLGLTLLFGWVLLAGYSQLTTRIDFLLYDTYQLFIAPARSDDVAIIAIDDRSLQTLGRWPWPRSTHAELIRQLSPFRPKAIGFDVIFNEPSASGSEDLLLAKAVAEAGNVILPVYIGSTQAGAALQEQLPIAQLAETAAGLGHVLIKLDTDGLARGFYAYEGLGQAHWPSLALAMFNLHNTSTLNPPTSGLSPHAHSLVRQDYRMIPYVADTPGIERIAYSDVLQGRVDAARLRNRWLLVGATSVGLGDVLPTPRTLGGQPTPGIEIHAHILNRLVTGKPFIQPVPWLLQASITLLLLWGLLLAYARIRPTQTLAFTLVALALSYAAGYVVLSVFSVWFAPATLLLGTVLAYLLWVASRFRRLYGFLNEALLRLTQANQQFPLPVAADRRHGSHDITRLEARIADVEEAIGISQAGRQFILQSLRQLPGAMSLTNRRGDIVLASNHFQPLLEPFATQETPAMADVLAPVETADTELWHEKIARVLEQQAEIEGELLYRGEAWYYRMTPLHHADLPDIGLIFYASNIQTLKDAQHQRNEAIDFLSHDLRSPISASLLQLEQMVATAPDELATQLNKVRDNLMRSNALADQFLSWARAEAVDEYLTQTHDLLDIIDNAMDVMSAMAERKGVTLTCQGEEEAVLCEVNGELMERAVQNLLSNAIKYGPEGGQVQVEVRIQGSHIALRVHDQGPGIAAEAADSLFQRFARLKQHQSSTGQGGIGLGLRFVRTVVERHGGDISLFDSSLGGACFCIRLPVRVGA